MNLAASVRLLHLATQHFRAKFCSKVSKHWRKREREREMGSRSYVYFNREAIHHARTMCYSCRQLTFVSISVNAASLYASVIFLYLFLFRLRRSDDQIVANYLYSKPRQLDGSFLSYIIGKKCKNQRLLYNFTSKHIFLFYFRKKLGIKKRSVLFTTNWGYGFF